jgi:hypothetical protein
LNAHLGVRLLLPEFIDQLNFVGVALEEELEEVLLSFVSS